MADAAQYPWMPLVISATTNCPIEGCGWTHTMRNGREIPRIKPLFMAHIRTAHPEVLVPLLPSPRRYFEAAAEVVPQHWQIVPAEQKAGIQQMIQTMVDELRNDGWEIQ